MTCQYLDAGQCTEANTPCPNADMECQYVLELEAEVDHLTKMLNRGMRRLKKAPVCEGGVDMLWAERTRSGELEWGKLMCPLAPEEGRVCGQWCAWYADNGNVATCKGEDIGYFVTLTKGGRHELHHL